jgi:hypothetical protein
VSLYISVTNSKLYFHESSFLCGLSVIKTRFLNLKSSWGFRTV